MPGAIAQEPVLTLRVVRHEIQPYEDSLREQESLVEAMHQGEIRHNTLILTSHPPIYTIGTSGSEEDILQREWNGVRIAVYKSGRGGEVTYHGPGQLLGYLIVDLRHRRDLHLHVRNLEELIIRVLADIGVTAKRNPRGIGVWIDGNKVAAIGVRCRRWICYHGVALNIDPDLRHFRGIVPCGMRDQPVTSLAREGVSCSRAELEPLLIHHARHIFDGD